MSWQELYETAEAIVADHKGILAADESTSTIKKRFDSIGVESTEETRRAYRDLLFTAPGIEDSIGGVIMYDETIRQRSHDGTPFAELLASKGVIPGIKVDTGAHDMAGFPGEKVTEGLDGLPARLTSYVEMGAKFAKWRAVFEITDDTPTLGAIRANASALARYAAACQEAGLVPIVEPEVLMNGDHDSGQCRDVTDEVHAAVRTELALLHVDLAGTVLKPNMILEGQDHRRRSTPEEVAETTVTVLRAWPGDLAGVAFLSGGQSPERATANLEAMQQHQTPWPLTFSFGRALVSPALTAWHGDPDRIADGQAALADRVVANAAAAQLGTELKSA